MWALTVWYWNIISCAYSDKWHGRQWRLYKWNSIYFKIKCVVLINEWNFEVSYFKFWVLTLSNSSSDKKTSWFFFHCKKFANIANMSKIFFRKIKDTLQNIAQHHIFWNVYDVIWNLFGTGKNNFRKLDTTLANELENFSCNKYLTCMEPVFLLWHLWKQQQS